MRSELSTRLGGALALGTLVLGGACQDGRIADPVGAPSFQSESSLPHFASTELLIPVSVSLVADAMDCTNNPGPVIAFSGAAQLGGFGVDLVFSNNFKGTHADVGEATVQSVTLLSLGDPITIPKQPVLGGVGGNPWIWIQFVDGAGNPTSPEYYLGRCVQGARLEFNGVTTAPASAVATLTTVSCENSPGPFISFDASLAFGGLGVQAIFRNQREDGAPHEANEVASAATVIPAGLSYEFPKQGALGGVGGNPWIFGAFTDGAAARLSTETLIGRCEQLSKLFS
jgi:hypothetical protein